MANGEREVAVSVRYFATLLFLLAGDRLCRPFAGPRIGMRALATYRQVTAMPQTPVAAEIHKALDVDRDLAAKVAFDLVIAVDGLANLQHLRVGKLADAPLGWDADLVDDLLGKTLADAVNVLKRDNHALVGRNVDACYAGHLVLHVGRWSGGYG